MQQPDLDAFAETVVLTIKTAMLPVLERLATLEQAQKDVAARVHEVPGLRDRVVAVETKAAIPPVVPTLPALPEPVDLTPLVTRIATVEASLAPLSDLRDRLVTVETKAAAVVPSPVDLSPVLDRLSTLEARPPVPGPAGADGRDGKDGSPGEKGQTGDRGQDGQAGRDGRDGLQGPAGEKGLSAHDGLPGLNGKDGRDGTLDQVKVLFDGERTATLCFKDGTPIEGGIITFPNMIYRGVYVAGKTYDRGDTTTNGGSLWHAVTTTNMKPGDGSKDWVLCAKRGSDGRDLRDGTPPPPLPVVSIGTKSVNDIESVRQSEAMKLAQPLEGQGRRD